MALATLDCIYNTVESVLGCYWVSVGGCNGLHRPELNSNHMLDLAALFTQIISVFVIEK